MSREELEALQAAAERDGVHITEWARGAILSALGLKNTETSVQRKFRHLRLGKKGNNDE